MAKITVCQQRLLAAKLAHPVTRILRRLNDLPLVGCRGLMLDPTQIDKWQMDCDGCGVFDRA